MGGISTGCRQHVLLHFTRNGPSMTMNTGNELGRPIEILLVEDNPGDADIAREGLESSKVRNKLHVVADRVSPKSVKLECKWLWVALAWRFRGLNNLWWRYCDKTGTTVKERTGMMKDPLVELAPLAEVIDCNSLVQRKAFKVAKLGVFWKDSCSSYDYTAKKLQVIDLKGILLEATTPTK